MLLRFLIEGKIYKGMGAVSLTALLSKNGKARVDGRKMPDAEQAQVHAPERQLFRALKDTLFRTSPVNKYISPEELIRGRPAVQYPVEEDSQYLRIFKEHSQENLEELLHGNPEAAESPYLLWGIEHFSEPGKFPEIYIADRELLLMRHGGIIVPFASYYLSKGGSLSVVCGPGIVHGSQNAVFRLFEQNGALQMLYYTSGKENVFENLRYAIAGFDIYFETTVPGNGFARPMEKGSIKRNFWTRDTLAEDYRGIAAAHTPNRMLLTPQNYKALLPRIELHAQ